MRILVALFVLAAGAAVVRGQGVNLAEIYPAELEPAEVPRGYEWTCGPSDVWSLRMFSYALGEQLMLDFGPSTVVFGRHGTSVLWAVVFPEKPGRVQSVVSEEGEAVAHVWLRFHPSLVAELFPPETVRGRGPGEKLWRARRVCYWKLNGSWQVGGQPRVPRKDALTFDLDTVAGKRRFFAVETAAGQAHYIQGFEARGLPALEKVKSKTALEVFDRVWEAFDREYAMFAIKPDVDWRELRETCRPKAAAAKTNYELAAIVAEMLAHLEDLHAGVRVGNEFVPGYTRARPANANWYTLKRVITDLHRTQQDLAWGRTADGIGYINIYRLGSRELPAKFDEVLETLADTWALIIDLRFNGGGDEKLGQRVAGRFLEKKCVYSLSQYRDGAKHTDLSRKHERVCEPRGPWRYESPVMVLLGQKTMSSAESFALMLAQTPQVTTMGDRTAGSSGNPRPLELPGNIFVSLPRWIDMDPSGKPIDAVGIMPQIKIDVKPEDLAAMRDPVLEAAFRQLRQQPEDQRRPGKRR